MHISKFLTLVSLCSLTLLAACGTQPVGSLTTTDVPADAKVTVVEFSDFNCPACQASYPITREVRQIAGVHFEYRNFPLDIPGHETSFAAANAYECGKAQGKADAFETALFENSEKFTDEFLRTLPAKYGFDMDLTAYQSCVDDQQFASKVTDDVRTATRTGLNSTPSFIVNGEVVSGARNLIDIVQAKLAQ